jgi:hypothetical protein
MSKSGASRLNPNLTLGIAAAEGLRALGPNNPNTAGLENQRNRLGVIGNVLSYVSNMSIFERH